MPTIQEQIDAIKEAVQSIELRVQIIEDVLRSLGYLKPQYTFEETSQ